MYKYITRFFAFLLPIIGKSIIQVAADELHKIAYPKRGRRLTSWEPTNPYTAQNRPRTMADVDKLERQRLERRRYSEYEKNRARADEVHAAFGDFHDVLMVAFDIAGTDAKDVQTWLMDNMPPADKHYGDNDEIYLDSWWIANDERFDGSDTDSAVFVKKGKQQAARELLRDHGLVD